MALKSPNNSQGVQVLMEFSCDIYLQRDCLSAGVLWPYTNVRQTGVGLFGKVASHVNHCDAE